MSDSQTAWKILCDWAGRRHGPFEISEVARAVAEALKVKPAKAERVISSLLKELDRLPEGRQYFRREGNAVVPLPELPPAAQDADKAARLYPFEV